MKKILYLLIVLGVIFTGCNPNEDINNDIDAEANSIIGTDAFTMTTEDYTNLVVQGSDDPVDYYEMFESFNNLDDAKVILPPFLAERYPYWGEGSSVTVSFNIYDGNPGDDVSAYANASVYQLSLADYPTTGGGAFFPNEDPQTTLETVLSNEFPTPMEGDVVRLEYKQFDAEPTAGFVIVYDGLFPDVYSNFENVDESGAQGWSEGSSYANASGFASGSANANEDWLISPSIDLSGQSDVLFQINQRISFLGGATLSDHINILVSTNYTGDPATTTWDTITLTTVPDGTNSDFILSEDYDFSSYDGQTVNIAFKYESTDSVAPLWRIDFFQLKTAGFSGDSTTNSKYYNFVDGLWDTVDNVYYLTPADYDSMGESSGQPGQFNNFSESVAPANYLPTFLNIKYPFAQEGDELFMVYRFYGGSGVGTVIRGNLYTVENGVWIPSITSLQFGYESGEWVPDNTIRYSLVGSDYGDVATALLAESGFEAAAENLDNFGNFNRTGGSTSWSDTMMVRALGIVLNNLDPNALDGQKYIVTFDMYNGSSGTEDFKMIKEAGEWQANQPLD